MSGQIPNLPSVLNKELPALDEPESKMIGDHLNMMHLPRKAFIAAESSEKMLRDVR